MTQPIITATNTINCNNYTFLYLKLNIYKLKAGETQKVMFLLQQEHVKKTEE